MMPANPIHILADTLYKFNEKHCIQFASALSYSTLIAVVPMTAFLFFLSLQTEMFSGLFDEVRTQLLNQLLPTSREQVETYLLATAKNIKSFSYLGMAFIFLSAILLSTGVEAALNHIWQVETQRRVYLRIPGHIILWIVAPLLLLASLSVSTWLISLPYLHDISTQASKFSILLPWFFSSIGLYFLYHYVPNARTKRSHAIASAMVAALLFELSKWAFTLYVTKYASYEKLYGALSTLPIFMLWIWISWMVVLLGASLGATLDEQSRRRH